MPLAMAWRISLIYGIGKRHRLCPAMQRLSYRRQHKLGGVWHRAFSAMQRQWRQQTAEIKSAGSGNDRRGSTEAWHH